MQFNRICKLLSLTVMFLFFVLSFNNIIVSAIVKIDTGFVDEGRVYLSYEKDDGTWDGTLWLGEKLSFPEEYVRTLKLIDGMYISKSSDLYQAIHNIVIRLIDIEMDAEYFTQLYQEGQIDYQQLRKDGDKAYQEVEILQKEIIDNLIKYKDQCLTREEAYAIE